MYCDYKEISEHLSCSYCCAKFTEVVKLIPQCGNSICGDCHATIMNNLDESNEFKCKVCDSECHQISPQGLPNNNVVMKMVNLSVIPKPLNDKTKTLKSTIEDIQQRIDMLKSYDGVQEINTYCDLLESEVMLTVDSSIRHLNKLRSSLMNSIYSYRNELLSNFSTADANAFDADCASDKAKKDLENLSSEFSEFNNHWTEYFVQLKVSWSDEKIEKAQLTAKQFNERMLSLEKTIRDQTFKSKFMRFTENPKFYVTNDHLGVLETPQEKTNSVVSEDPKTVSPFGCYTGSYYPLPLNIPALPTSNSFPNQPMPMFVQAGDVVFPHVRK